MEPRINREDIFKRMCQTGPLIGSVPVSKSRYLQGRGPMTGTTGVRGQGKVDLEEVANGLAGQKPFGEIIGRSRAIRLQIEKAGRFARYDSAVLICGETGTGKGIFARAIHLAGSRSEQPFVQV